MNTLKKYTLSTTGFAILFLLLTGMYNSIQVNSSEFMRTPTDIRFVKRLDEIKGKIRIGRMAASTIKWSSLAAAEASSPVKLKPSSEVSNKNNITIKKTVKKKVVTKQVVQEPSLPAPAVNADLDMKLSKVFFKKPLENGSFSGSAKTVDGVIEEVYVELPDGKLIEINTRDRMVGNVFQYEDTQTRELKSGMFYEVKRGTYMITLTNDSEYAGLRLEFEAENDNAVAYGEDYQQDISWGMNTQNPVNEQHANNDHHNEVLPSTQAEESYGHESTEYGHVDIEENSKYGFEFKS